MTVSIWVLVAVVIAAVILGFVPFLAGISYRKKTGEKQIGSARDEAKRIINEALKTAETKKKEALLEAKEELLRERTEQEKELKERRVEITRQEKRLQQREEVLDKKYDNIDRKEEALAAGKAAPAVARFMEGKKLVKEIYVPGKIINIVVK